VKAHKLVEPFVALKAAAAQRKAEALSARLCHSDDEFIYEITLLHRDGRLSHVEMGRTRANSFQARRTRRVNRRNKPGKGCRRPVFGPQREASKLSGAAARTACAQSGPLVSLKILHPAERSSAFASAQSRSISSRPAHSGVRPPSARPFKIGAVNKRKHKKADLG
jgi:hypothetical protein